MIETVGINLMEDMFKNLVHMVIYQACQKEKEHFEENKYYEGQETDKKLLDYLFRTRPEIKEVLLNEKIESYGNTMLHISCQLHSFIFTKYLLRMGSDVSIKNEKDKTPEEIVEDEIKYQKGLPDTRTKQLTIERLNFIKSLFMKM